MQIDRINCSDIEIKAEIISVAPVIRGKRVPAQAVLDNANDGFTAEDIVADIYPGLPVEPTRRRHCPIPQTTASPATLSVVCISPTNSTRSRERFGVCVNEVHP
jgi:uncharacterized protein (DUF433 family)